jgi:hypothetical protein
MRDPVTKMRFEKQSMVFSRIGNAMHQTIGYSPQVTRKTHENPDQRLIQLRFDMHPGQCGNSAQRTA